MLPLVSFIILILSNLSIVVSQDLDCPFGTTQVGSIGADIRDCGLVGCIDTYSTINDCQNACSTNKDCNSFNWYPHGGASFSPSTTICVLYEETSPSVSTSEIVIFCKLDIKCPLGTIQKGNIGADIQGTGLWGFQTKTMDECHQFCAEDWYCRSFNWYPTYAGNSNQCVIYSETDPDYTSSDLTLFCSLNNKITIKLIKYSFRIWTDAGSGADLDGSIWAPSSEYENDFYYFTFVNVIGHPSFNEYNEQTIVITGATDGALATPLSCKWIWNDSGSGADQDVYVNRPIPRDGYVCFGDFITNYAINNCHDYDWKNYRCIREDFITKTYYSSSNTQKIWHDIGSGADHDVQFYKIITNELPYNYYKAKNNRDHINPPFLTFSLESTICGDDNSVTCNTLICPDYTTKMGQINADIAGCGLEGCIFNLNTIENCRNRCQNNNNCHSFTWAPPYGHGTSSESVCTLYSEYKPNNSWGPKQILCILDSALASYNSPVLKFHENTLGYPQNAQLYIDNGGNGNENLVLDTTSNPTYFRIVSNCINQEFEYNIIAYWWWYGRQSACDTFLFGTFQVGEHDCDWEDIYVYTNKNNNEIEYVKFFQHGGHYTVWGYDTSGYLYYEWSNDDQNNHPKVYVGRTAHGSYQDSNDYTGFTECGYFYDKRDDHYSLYTRHNLINLDNSNENWIVTGEGGDVTNCGTGPLRTDSNSICNEVYCEDAGCYHSSCDETSELISPTTSYHCYKR